MKSDDEIDVLLGEIPHATSSLNLQEMLINATTQYHHGFAHASCVTPKMSADEASKRKTAFASSNSPLSGFSLQSGSATSLFSGDISPPQFDVSGGGLCLDLKRANEGSLVDCFSSMRIKDECGVQSRNWSSRSFNPRKGAGFEGEEMANLLASRYSSSSHTDRRLGWSHFGRQNCLANSGFPMGFVLPNATPSLDSPLVGNSSPFYPRKSLIESSDSFYSVSPRYSEDSLIRFNERNKVVPLRVRVPRGSVDPFGREDSLIIQGEGLNHAIARKGFHHENGVWKAHERRSQLDDHLHAAESPKMHCPFNRPMKFSSLAEAQGYIYHIAKDQQGCRFLQRMFDDGNSLDVQIIFNEIIDHAVELMMNPFGNYLMQKLLEVCNEEQRMHILLRVTEEPGKLVRISLNTHGTRVVQKLIETLKTKQQIALVISALESGFLALIKDLNGNHVIQRCLQSFPAEDSKFIFVAAAKYCVDIATHQHGCCVLQRCISHSTGEHRENLVAEISENGLLLSEDAFGNYVVQFILELKIPSATSKLTSQFEGNYVHLSSQKFSSHVVEKCLLVCEEVRTNVIHELLSSSCFDRLLQDPHANYVIQTALRVSEGNLHNSLVDAIETHKSISRNSPYSKRIFSQKLLKR
ncbi:putative pumilio homolog 8, chloroplastic [Salvia hispanica]|uniref:putative pumilio homolog 8, chloroplastic n=1 Tax=Salvia hispanica TaxID=49212 RepID=UPI0020095039|nr:putative pumilio homolog 8, chloroplastic [Salvia hispanica]